MSKQRGRITKIYDVPSVGTAVKTDGVKKKDQSKYENDSRNKGDNGTYLSDFGHIPSQIIFEILVYGDSKKQTEDSRVKVDLKEEVLNFNEMQRISPQLIMYLEEKNRGKKVDLKVENGNYTIDLDSIDIKYK